MNWMFEPRSKDWYDNDPAGKTYAPPMQCHEVPLALLYFILFLIWFLIVEFAIPIGLIYHEFYSEAKRVSECGKPDFPCLIMSGVPIVIVLLILRSTHLFDVTKHPFIMICFSIFILLFAAAPLTGLVWRSFKK